MVRRLDSVLQLLTLSLLRRLNVVEVKVLDLLDVELLAERRRERHIAFAHWHAVSRQGPLASEEAVDFGCVLSLHPVILDDAGR